MLIANRNSKLITNIMIEESLCKLEDLIGQLEIKMKFLQEEYHTIEDYENYLDKNLDAAKLHKNFAYQLATLSLA